MSTKSRMGKNNLTLVQNREQKRVNLLRYCEDFQRKRTGTRLPNVHFANKDFRAMDAVADIILKQSSCNSSLDTEDHTEEVSKTHILLDKFGKTTEIMQNIGEQLHDVMKETTPFISVLQPKPSYLDDLAVSVDMLNALKGLEENLVCNVHVLGENFDCHGPKRCAVPQYAELLTLAQGNMEAAARMSSMALKYYGDLHKLNGYFSEHQLNDQDQT